MIQIFLRSFACFVVILFSSCTRHSKDLPSFYSHLTKQSHLQEDDYFLILLVDAPHLDYTNVHKFFDSVATKRDGSRSGEIGHAWIYLKGMQDHQVIVVEGGHSGEIEDPPARYFDGIMNYNEYGVANPNWRHPSLLCYEPNPVKYLWMIRKDGFFQKGSGGHQPSFAAKVPLTPEQFNEIVNYINHTSFREYGLMNAQNCCTFVTDIASMAGLSLSSQTKMKIPSKFYYRNAWIRLWEDPCYSVITFSTADVIEKSLMHAVEKGQAEYALEWYLSNL